MGLIFKSPSGVILELRRGSLLEQKDLDAIVNAQNCRMRGGNGINGAIHEAAGEELMEELIEKAPRGCATGGVIDTGGFESGFKTILHTPGPVWIDGVSGEYMSLSICYLNCLTRAAALGHGSIGFCSISTGIFGFPLLEAVPTAIGAVCQWLDKYGNNHSIDRIVFSMFTEEEYNAYHAAFEVLKANWNL